MLTLLVDSYGQKYKKYVANYLTLMAGFSDLRLVQEKEAVPRYDLSGVDAVVLSGSERYITKGDYSEDFLEFIRRVKVPLLGVCYGHQVLALAHGQRVRRYTYLVRKKYPQNPERIKIRKPGRLFRNIPTPVLGDESHREEVVLVDRRFDLLASSRSCEVEAIRLRKTDHFGLQFHLERSGEFGLSIMKNFFGIARSAKRVRERME
jgi:GMP synthase (glutamine-hydrolysing)